MILRLVVFVTLGLIPVAAAGQSPARDSVVYDLAPSSRLVVRTGKAGLLGFAGHEHLIQAREFSGRIVYYPHQPEASQVTVSIAAGRLEVLTPPDTAEIRKVTAALRADVLDVAQHPEITLTTQSVEEAGDTLRVQAALTIKGQTRTVPLTVRVRIGPDTLHAATTFTVRQSDYGIRPYRGGPGGTVRVADAITFDIDAVALRRPPP
jgi:polyisoprenoid-binding protein YceI